LNNKLWQKVANKIKINVIISWRGKFAFIIKNLKTKHKYIDL